ncbi:hypothetical protein HG530_002790 [Fusarium avenaceum]|nr:hypothetical protein HG530_002790 [Fusarium avenaceum]
MAGGRKAKPATPKGPSTTLVLDNGAATIKAGLVRDGKIDEPRIIPNVIARDRARKVYVASELEKCRDFGEIQFRRPMEKGSIVNWEAQKEIWDRELFENKACKFDPAETRLILAEAPNGLPILQTNCDQIVFEEYGFTSYYRGIGPSFNAYHDIQNVFRTPQENPTVANIPTEALMVIDSGYSHTTITPLLRGQPLHSAIKRLDVGGKVLTNYLTRLISLRHFDMRNDTYIVNEMKELSCYVAADFKADIEKTWKGTRGERRPDYLSGGGIAKDYILPDFHTRSNGTLTDYEPSRHSKAKKLANQSEEDALTLRNERFAVPELLFSPSDVGIRQPGLADLVQESLNELPIGLWPSMLANIIVVGGNTHFDGFIQRLQKEVVQRVPDDCIVRVARPADPVTQTWYGGANLANHPHIERLAVTKKEYEEHGSSWVAHRVARDESVGANAISAPAVGYKPGLSNTSRTAVDEDLVASLDIRRNGLIRRQSRCSNTGRLLQIKLLRDDTVTLALTHGELRQRSKSLHGRSPREDEIAFFGIRHVICDCDNAATEIHAWGLGERGDETGGHTQLDDLVVGGVDGGVGDLNEDLACLEALLRGLGDGVAELEDALERARVGDLPCLHLLRHCVW